MPYNVVTSAPVKETLFHAVFEPQWWLYGTHNCVVLFN